MSPYRGKRGPFARETQQFSGRGLDSPRRYLSLTSSPHSDIGTYSQPSDGSSAAGAVAATAAGAAVAVFFFRVRAPPLPPGGFFFSAAPALCGPPASRPASPGPSPRLPARGMVLPPSGRPT